MCLFELRKFIKKGTNSVFGLDFPFGLPWELVRESIWEKFILSFPENYLDDRDFRDKCRKDSHNREIKRRTDVENKTKFPRFWRLDFFWGKYK